jgi:hypothetical protein
MNHVKSVNDKMKSKVINLVNHYENHNIVGINKKTLEESLEPDSTNFKNLQDVLLINQDLKKEWLLN